MPLYTGRFSCFSEVHRPRYRQRLLRQWLYGELLGGVAWPRREPRDDRKATPVLGFALELRFGPEY